MAEAALRALTLLRLGRAADEVDALDVAPSVLAHDDVRGWVQLHDTLVYGNACPVDASVRLEAVYH